MLQETIKHQPTSKSVPKGGGITSIKLKFKSISGRTWCTIATKGSLKRQHRKWKKRKVTIRLLTFFLAKSLNPLYCLKNKPERKKYSGILKLYNATFKCGKIESNKLPPQCPITISIIHNPFIKSI